MYYALAWVVIMIAFGILEGMTASLVSIWFCSGALVALIATVLGAGIGIQLGVFALVSLLCIALVRPFAKNVLRPNEEKTNADRILGVEGVVTEAISNRDAKGQIRVLGEYWTARTEHEAELPEGTLVRVLRIEGVKAIVAHE